MDKLRYTILLLTALTLFSCEEDTAPDATAPDLFLEAPSDRGRSFITLNGSISAADQIKEAGFVVWKTGTEGGEITYKIEDYSNNRVTANIRDLEVGTTYSYYMYISNDINMKKSEEQDFTTPKTSAALISATSVNGNTYTAQIEDNGGSKITTKGFCWSLTGKASIFDYTVLVEDANSDITATIPELASATSYSIRAFAQNEEGYLAYGAEINYVNEDYPLNIPEGEFKNYLLQNFDLNRDGILSNAEAQKVEKIELYSDKIKSLDGIEYFTNLKHLTICGTGESYDSINNTWIGNGILETLDISKNTELIELDCSKNKLSELNVSKNKKLLRLSFGSNNLTRLDLNHNTELMLIYGNYNLLEELNIENCQKLISLSLYTNRLTHLDVSKNTNLVSLNLQMNLLKDLNINNLTELSGLYVDWNQLETLDVSNNKKLRFLQCWLNQLRVLNTRNNPLLENLYCDGNNLTSLDLTQNKELRELRCYQNNIGPELDISNNTKLEVFNAEDIPDIATNPNLRTIWVWQGFNKANNENFKKPANAIYKVK